MKTNIPVVVLVLATFFMISFITNILGPIFPALIDSFDIGLTLAGFFPFAFFIAYGVMSIPAGLLVQSWGEKHVMLLAFLLAALGAVAFVLIPVFAVAMTALFLLGSAMALLQVAVNPLLRESGGSQHFALLSVLAQLMFGGAATLSPLVYSQLLEQTQTGQGVGAMIAPSIPANMGWLSMYWLFAALSVAMLVWIALTPIKRAQRNADERLSAKQSLQYFKNPTAIKFFFAIAAYVALEQGIANSMSVFLQQQHGLEPNTEGAAVVSHFWLSLTLGCLLGLVLLKCVDAQKLLMFFSVGAALCLVVALFGSQSLAVLAFPACGFFLSIMWSVIFSLALNSFKAGHGAVAGILCTGIIGGAVASPIIGAISQGIGSLQIAILVLFIPLIYIFSVGIWARPLVRNHTLNLFKKSVSNEELKSPS
ncbi:MFS transporter [Pseudoalteromonas ruthenica]|nr:MFS transporter [Pseudoalteromonas ruthenica]|tara:strand:+ start:50996 stop:52264 length:1269 start_codon:yes stop_codon:yes gene_type:complete